AMLFFAVASAPNAMSVLTISKWPSCADLMIGYPCGLCGDAPRSSKRRTSS
ncbi:hypothetical protein BDB00DRAFT_734084, partial [Zychaea mexicana]|uniref:uncharacterized protein n=1 Tax=Zychaea mexicana TaxID=64656 RepID=UPI0022FE297A